MLLICMNFIKSRNCLTFRVYVKNTQLERGYIESLEMRREVKAGRRKRRPALAINERLKNYADGDG